VRSGSRGFAMPILRRKFHPNQMEVTPMHPIVPTPEQITSGVACSKQMIAEAEAGVPFLVSDFITQKATDEAITNAVTRLAAAILNPPTS
jgi:hypothetical protein